MLQITPTFFLNERELVYVFIRASGPGGQNVNKVATAVQLRFDLQNSPSLMPELKNNLIKLSGKRVTKDGVLVIEAKRYRTQEQNRIDATQRLVTLVQRAISRPKTRRKTSPSVSAQDARLKSKKRHGTIKYIRQSKPDRDE